MLAIERSQLQRGVGRRSSQARDHWDLESEARREAAVAAQSERDAWVDANALDLRGALAASAALARDGALARDNVLRDLVASRVRDGRPDSLVERSAWAASALQFAEVELEGPDLDAPAPELDVPEFDLGP